MTRRATSSNRIEASPTLPLRRERRSRFRKNPGALAPLVILILLVRNIFCSAQETPLFTTPLMDYSQGTHRQSVCHLQAQLHNGTLELRNALQGLQLRPVLFASSISSLMLPPNATTLPETSPGIIVEILDQLAQRAQFTWRESYGLARPDESPLWQAGDNITFDDVLEWSTEMYDLSCTLWTQSVPRLNLGVTFPEGWYDASIILVGETESSGRTFDMWSFAEPFSPGVWGLIAASILVSGLVYQWMERYDNGTDKQELSRRPTENLFYAAISFTGDNRYEPSSDYGRLFVFSMGFFFLLIGSAYTANLASFLVVQNQPQSSVESVGDAVTQGKVMCVVSGGGGGYALVVDKYPTAKFFQVEKEDDLYTGLANGDCDYILTVVGEWQRSRGKAASNPDCRLQWIGRVFRFLNGGFAVTSDSGTLCSNLIRDSIHLHLLEMIEDGFVQDAWEREYARTATQNCDAVSSTSSSSNDDSETFQLDIPAMGGIFVVHFGLVFIAICLALATKRKNPFSCSNKRQDTNADETVVSEKQTKENVSNSASPLASMANKQDEKLETLTEQVQALLQQLDSVKEDSRQMQELIQRRNGANAQSIYQGTFESDNVHNA